jgi:hypothetical protein
MRSGGQTGGLMCLDDRGIALQMFHSRKQI